MSMCVMLLLLLHILIRLYVIRMLHMRSVGSFLKNQIYFACYRLKSKELIFITILNNCKIMYYDVLCR